MAQCGALHNENTIGNSASESLKLSINKIMAKMNPKLMHVFFIFLIKGAFYGIVICGMRNLRVWYGPLPELVCIAQAKMTQAVLTCGVVGCVMIIITKFVFICVWRSMRSIDDNLLKRIALNEIILLCFLHSWCWPQSNSSGSEVCTLYKLLLVETRNADF